MRRDLLKFIYDQLREQLRMNRWMIDDAERELRSAVGRSAREFAARRLNDAEQEARRLADALGELRRNVQPAAKGVQR